ncbi:hypothetical protein HPB48_009509 [Haemaphysalis longicornis]|uniref:Peptidase M13 N-terminal domain-containing protein n=1 Tax=Haemaphysalis longicornis TaxID=44386 RepID=A0A9J6GG27_HAELO|nr:hypothetical protein HPB48_009509 [Haemaphysalis longicornis]
MPVGGAPGGGRKPGTYRDKNPEAARTGKRSSGSGRLLHSPPSITRSSAASPQTHEQARAIARGKALTPGTATASVTPGTATASEVPSTHRSVQAKRQSKGFHSPASDARKSAPSKHAAAAATAKRSSSAKLKPHRDSNPRSIAPEEDKAKAPLVTASAAPSVEKGTPTGPQEPAPAAQPLAEEPAAPPAGGPALSCAPSPAGRAPIEPNQLPATAVVAKKPTSHRVRVPPRGTRSKSPDPDGDISPTEMESYTPPDCRKGDRKKSIFASMGFLSFYPLNVSFETEANTKEERYLRAALVTGVAVIFGVVVVGVVLMLMHNRASDPAACDTEECNAAREYLKRLLNTSKDPCRDFYGYVCDSWLARGNGTASKSFLGDSVAASLATINERLLEEKPLDVNGGSDGLSAGRLVMRRLYRSCHRYITDQSASAAFPDTLETARKMLNWTAINSARTTDELVTSLVQTSLVTGFHTSPCARSSRRERSDPPATVMWNLSACEADTHGRPEGIRARPWASH